MAGLISPKVLPEASYLSGSVHCFFEKLAHTCTDHTLWVPGQSVLSVSMDPVYSDGVVLASWRVNVDMRQFCGDASFEMPWQAVARAGVTSFVSQS